MPFSRHLASLWHCFVGEDRAFSDFSDISLNSDSFSAGNCSAIFSAVDSALAFEAQKTIACFFLAVVSIAAAIVLSAVLFSCMVMSGFSPKKGLK